MLLGNVVLWVTPLWLLAVGATIGLGILLALYGLLLLVSKRTADEVPVMLREGVMQFIFYMLIGAAAFTFLAAVKMPYERLLSSTARIFAVQDVHRAVVVPPAAERQRLSLHFRGEELQSYEITSTHDVLIGFKSDVEETFSALHVQGGEPSVWAKGEQRDLAFAGRVMELYLTNDGDAAAKVNLAFHSDVEYPQVYSIPVVALGVVALFLLYFSIHFFAPKVAAIAATTSWQAVAQPIYVLALALGAFLMLAFVFLPYNTFGEDVKMLKDTGLVLIMVLSIIVAVWTASVSVADEIEGRTALTLLSKPIGRRQFVLGKFVGIIWPTVLLFIVLGTWFLLLVSYKVVYDARETANEAPSWQACYAEVVQVVPGLALSLMETIVLASIAVAISTRLPMVPNLIICASIYALGHLSPLLVESSAAQFEIVRFVGTLIATILPNLDNYNNQAAVATGVHVPVVYLAWATLLTAVYCTIAMLLALLLFEDRDLA